MTDNKIKKDPQNLKLNKKKNTDKTKKYLMSWHGERKWGLTKQLVFGEENKT